MTIIDPSTPLGMLRLRCADYGDLPFLPDSVYLQTLADNGDNLPASAKICATYILGMLSFKVHRKMGLQLEVWNNTQYTNYRDYLLLTATNPAFMSSSPIPYAATADFSPIADFQANWNRTYFNGTESQALARLADISPNDNSRTGWGSLY